MIETPRSLFAGAAASLVADVDFTVTLNAGTAVGDRVWVFHGVDAGDTSPVDPVMTALDSKGNTWTTFQTLIRNGVTGGTVATMGFTSVITNALVAGDTITIRNVNSDFGAVRRATVVAASSGVGTLDQQAVYTGSSNSLSLSIGPTGNTDTANEIVWAWWASGVQAFEPGPGYTEFAEVFTTETSTHRQLAVQYKIVSTTGPQTATATLAANSTNVGAMSTWRGTETPVVETGVYVLNASGIWEPSEIVIL